MSDGADFVIDAALEHGFDFEEGFVVGIEFGAVLDAAKGGVEDGETVPGFEDVEEILSFDAIHGGEPCIYGTTIRS